MSPGTYPMEAGPQRAHHEDMDGVAEEFISTYIGQILNPGYFVAAAAGVGLLMTGLGARIVEFGQAVTYGLTDRRARTRLNATDRSRRKNSLLTTRPRRRMVACRWSSDSSSMTRWRNAARSRHARTPSVST